jgi:hypothetical protein
MTVYDIVSACEFTGCVIVNQLGEEISTKNKSETELKEIYDKSVEHIDSVNNTTRIWTFDKIDEIEGLTEKEYDTYKRANPKWDTLMDAVLLQIRKELDRLSWNKYQKEKDSPFDNTGQVYSNKIFTVRAYNWNDEEEEELPNFECDPVKVYWYKHQGRGTTVYTRPYFDSPGIYALVLDKCIKALKEDFGETSE